jgi:hypothetical protein
MDILSQGLDTGTLHKVLSSTCVNPELQCLFIDILILDSADDNIVRTCTLSIQRVVTKLSVMSEVKRFELIRKLVCFVEVDDYRVCPNLIICGIKETARTVRNIQSGCCCGRQDGTCQCDPPLHGYGDGTEKQNDIDEEEGQEGKVYKKRQKG